LLCGPRGPDTGIDAGESYYFVVEEQPQRSGHGDRDAAEETIKFVEAYGGKIVATVIVDGPHGSFCFQPGLTEAAVVTLEAIREQ